MPVNASIIVPVYNVEPFVGDCIKSVMNQTYQGGMECIIVDDGCTDGSMAVIEKLLRRYQGHIRFELCRHDKNRGLSAARNTGTMVASGEYLFYLDSDDIMATNCIEMLMAQTLPESEVELVQGNTEAIPVKLSASYTRHFSMLHAKGNQEVRYCYYLNEQMPCNAWNKLVKRDFLLKHDLLFKEGSLYEDVLWSFHLMKYLSNVKFVSEVTYYTRFRPGSIMSGTDQFTSAIHYQRLYQDILTDLTIGFEKMELAFYAKAFAKMYVSRVRVLPELKALYQKYWDRAWGFGLIGTCARLSFNRFLGMFKWGWIVVGMMRRLEQPSRLKDDIDRIQHRMK